MQGRTTITKIRSQDLLVLDHFYRCSKLHFRCKVSAVCCIHWSKNASVEWSEVATRTPAAEQCPWSPHIAEWSPPPPVWMRTWAREWKLQSNKLDSGITPSLEIIFNKFPKVADFDYIFQPGAGNWLKRVGCPNLCIPGCMKYDYGSTIWIAF